MIDPNKAAPRRYFLDAHGHRVLIGLSADETAEFEALDLPSMNAHADPMKNCQSENLAEQGKLRWLELYSKHESAWQTWKVQSRAEQAADSGFVNYISPILGN